MEAGPQLAPGGIATSDTRASAAKSELLNKLAIAIQEDKIQNKSPRQIAGIRGSV